MTTEIQTTETRDLAVVAESLVTRGDLSGLTPAERARHYIRTCEGPGHDELRRWREQGRAPAGSCPFCASRISVVERDGVFVARCSHRGCGARGPKHHDLTRACDLFCCPPQRTAGGMGGIDAGGVL